MEQKNALPAILLPVFGSAEASFSIASKLHQQGYPILTVTAPDDAASLDAARGAGFEIIEAEKDDALRAGLQYCADRMPGLPGVIWLEGAQGFSCADTFAVASVAAVNPDAAVVASRAKSPEAGMAERILRVAARVAFIISHQRDVRDAWSGLMYLPAKHIDGFLAEKGRGDAYRLRLLLTMQRRGARVIDVPVSARCAGEVNGKAMLLDVLNIALVPLMFVASSLTLTAADYVMRTLVILWLAPGNKELSLAVGRYTGAAVGYLINRKAVFHRPGMTWWGEAVTLIKYAALATGMYYAALSISGLLIGALGFPVAWAWICTDLLLYPLNFLLQREVVFRRKQSAQRSVCA